MDQNLTLVLSLVAALAVNITKKYFTDRNRALSGGFVFNAVSTLVAAAVLLPWGGFGTASAFTLLMGIAFGAITALQGITSIAALGCGPMSYTSVIISFSTLISALSGVMFFGETLGWAQAVGIIFMLASFALAAERGAETKKANFKWLLLCLVAFFATGAIGIMQKVHQSSAYKGELNAFLIVAFVSSAVLCSLMAVVSGARERTGEGDVERGENGKKALFAALLLMLINGVCVSLNNKFNLYLSGVMESAVFFPIVNGGGLVLSTLAAVAVFKERLTKKQWLGVALGIISVIFLCNPFG